MNRRPRHMTTRHPAQATATPGPLAAVRAATAAAAALRLIHWRGVVMVAGGMEAVTTEGHVGDIAGRSGVVGHLDLLLRVGVGRGVGVVWLGVVPLLGGPR